MASKIEWTHTTWNPTTGCTKISPGCKNCYAERMAKRLMHMGQEQYKNGFALSLAPHMLERPRSWKKPRLVFVDSMSDLFHKDIPLDYIKKVFEVMNTTPHIYQVLTKREERLLEIHEELNWTDNIWMGVSIESEKYAFRAQYLKTTHAKNKFLSIEPLLGPINDLDLTGMDWVIVGGESGPKARPVKKEWIERIQQICANEGVPFFFKQWGTNRFNPDSFDLTAKVGNENFGKGGCTLNGKIYREMPEAFKSIA